MSEYLQQKVDAALQVAQQAQRDVAMLVQQSKALAAELQQTRDVLEALGAASGWEWLSDLKTWVDTNRLRALKHSPRETRE